VLYYIHTDRRYVENLDTHHMAKSLEKTETKQTIMDVALNLFYKQGFNNTSVEKIVTDAHVSKGAFYHYFKTKDAVFEAIVKNFFDDGMEALRLIAEDKNLNALEKFQKLLSWPNNFFDLKYFNIPQAIKVGAVMVQIDSTDLFDKLREYTAERLHPYLLTIFKQGANERVFQIEYPEETCEFYVEYVTNFKRKMFKMMKDGPMTKAKISIVFHQIKFLESMMDKLLGVSPGTIKFGPKGMETFKKIFLHNASLAKTYGNKTS